MTENTVSASAEPETNLTKKQQKIREHRHRIRRAAHFFVYESKNVSTIAKAFNTTEKEIFAWSKTGLWQKVLHEDRYTGAIRSPMWKEQLPEKIPYALTEKYLLTQAFIAEGDTVRFVTYSGFKDVKIKKIHPYSYDLDDNSQIDKIEILLAFPRSPHHHRGDRDTMGILRLQGQLLLVDAPGLGVRGRGGREPRQIHVHGA